MRQLKGQKGFAIIEVLLIVVILGIIAFVAWRVIEANGDVETAQNQVPLSTPAPSSDVPAANNVNDLTVLEDQLNKTTVDDNTSAELDTETTFE
jgi:hypothetical protein